MHNYGDSGPSGLRPVSIIMPFAFGYTLKGVSWLSLCSFRTSDGAQVRMPAFHTECGTVWAVRPQATVKNLPSMPGGSCASVMWGQSCHYHTYCHIILEVGTFEPYSLGEFATFALILNPSAKIMGMTARFRAVLC